MRKYKLWICLALSLFFLGGFSETNSLEILDISQKPTNSIKIRGFSVRPMRLMVFPFEDSRKLQGQINFKQSENTIKLAKFILKTDKGTEIWNQEASYEKKWLKDEKNNELEIPINISLSDEFVAVGDLVFEVFLYGQNNQVESFADKRLSFPEAEEAKSLSTLEVSLNKDEDNLDIKATFNNANESANFTLKTVLKRKDEIISEIKSSEILVENEEEKDFSVNILLPENPNLYNLEVWMVDEDDKKITGVFRENITVQGAFAEIQNVVLKNKVYTRKGRNNAIVVSGIATSKTKKIVFKGIIKSKENDLQNVSKIADIKKEITVGAGGQFMVDLDFVAMQDASKIIANIEVLVDGIEVDHIDFESREFVKSQESFYEKTFDVITEPLAGFNLTRVQKLTVLIVVLLVVFGLLALIVFIVKKSRKNNDNLSIFLIFGLGLLGFLLTGETLAQEQLCNGVSINYRHFENEVYTSNSEDSNEGFSKIPFRGIIKCDTEGIFIEDSYKAQVWITPPSGGSAFGVKTGILDKKYSDEYFFEIDVKGANEFNDAGEYTIEQIYFWVDENSLIPYEVNFSNFGGLEMIGDNDELSNIDTTSNFTFFIDNEKPKGEFTLKTTDDDEEEITLNQDIGSLQTELSEMEEGSDKLAKVREYFTKNDITVSLGCIGGECTNEDIIVRGNFCDDEEICDIEGTRNYKICDQVGNCSDDNELIIKNYDSEPPIISATVNPELEETENPSGNYKIDTDDDSSSAKTTKAFTDYLFNIMGVRDEKTLKNTDDLDANACGDEEISAFRENNNLCHPKKIVCAGGSTKRGAKQFWTEEGVFDENLECSAQCDIYSEPDFCTEADRQAGNNRDCCSPLACRSGFGLCFPGLLLDEGGEVDSGFSCGVGFHKENGECIDNTMLCETEVANGACIKRWDGSASAWEKIITCNGEGFHEENGECIDNTMLCETEVANGACIKRWDGSAWEKIITCDGDYHLNLDGDACLFNYISDPLEENLFILR